jgi:hypothetical protein
MVMKLGTIEDLKHYRNRVCNIYAERLTLIDNGHI